MVATVEVPHMNAGDGETSYANNSLLQRVVISKARPIMEETIENMFSTTIFPGCFNVADLGCSSGPNTLLVLSEILDIIHEMCRQVNRKTPEFQMFLNDLPGNDFNTIFKSLPAFYKQRKLNGSSSKSCFIAGVPGSFYGRLFPSTSIHFMHSSYSLHWLSERKLKGNSSESCFIAGVPGSFYGRLFPSKSIHFMHSSYSLHWLSKVPENLDRNNKTNIYIWQSQAFPVYIRFTWSNFREISLCF
ncbi:Carboxyl methyltransferase [Melia azedarach]|uniref:Carboxyl methyltransferase n=1 Tax=Melia azedarach TaxID=155640 RepID=A0ACC1Y1M5_MELAZ|nr:Carboxyl methyltransferase [Melia azedarach]